MSAPPEIAEYDRVKCHLLPLLEGSAFSEMKSAPVHSYLDLKKHLLSRFGKTTDDVITSLMAQKQGNLSLPDYLDKVVDLT